jgi:digeranylgeranylglycerophospholipid reductase
MATIESIPERVDVFIAGAGPAGLSAALRLLNAGATVAMVDTRSRLGHPLRCGEVTTHRYFELFGIEPRTSWIRCVLGEKKRMIALDRERCENEIAAIVAERGAAVVPGVGVIGVSDYDGTSRTVTIRNQTMERKISARCVIAADGVASSVARFAGLNTLLPLNQIATGYGYRIVEAELRHPHLFVHEPLPPPFPAYPSYFWVIPNGNGSANVGLAIPASLGTKARLLLHQMMSQTTSYKNGRIVQRVVGAVSIAPPLEKPFTNGLLVVGGAARLVDPTTGGGLWAAVTSGGAAAETIVELGTSDATEERLSVYRNRIGPFVYKMLKNQWETMQINIARIRQGIPINDDRFSGGKGFK